MDTVPWVPEIIVLGMLHPVVAMTAVRMSPIKAARQVRFTISSFFQERVPVSISPLL
jgi:hypothetical protein